jgi:hypothetical protein
MDQSTAPPPPAVATDRPDRDISADFAQQLLAATFETMPIRPGDDPTHLNIREGATCNALQSLNARSPIEMMFAAHVVASHHATMECFSRAMRSTNNADVASRMHRNAAVLSRMMADSVKHLEARQQQDRNRGGKTP